MEEGEKRRGKVVSEDWMMRRFRSFFSFLERKESKKGHFT